MFVVVLIFWLILAAYFLGIWDGRRGRRIVYHPYKDQLMSIPEEAVNEAIRIAHREGMNYNKIPRMRWKPPESGGDDPRGSWLVEVRPGTGSGTEDIND